ncbi:WXG100 family type VII secretion target [Sphaerisporangium sp. TRM90804]|uniref:WXG100 family type VII secretion target n=1 Tax=Sphaerisporangium sp. TRM90804 TaxID=3031113 RepID=UPI00244C882C|nr:WXG100 family type VII secretion target [Sphaerisporangium sp. TRM90804]MDH2425091.1 WXG100 family type VII secretion target [Sphaerisporangium sp. TRM90804]
MAINNDVDRTLVNFGSMATGAQDFARQWQAMEGTLQQLETDLDRLLGEWDGDARAAYWTARGQWDAASGRMAALLKQLGAVIELGHENFSLAEKANVTMFDGR